MNNSKLNIYADDFIIACNIIKVSYIRRIKNKWRVFSGKGKVLGTYDTKAEAEHRLRSIEYWKHHNKKASPEDSYSSIMRELVKSYDKDTINKFQQEFKKVFDNALINNNKKPEKIALEEALKTLSYEDDEKAFKKMASVIELGDPGYAGKYLSDLIKFILRRISPERRQKSISNLKNKIYYLNEYSIASKKIPPSASIGQAITLLKNILLEHNPQYIRNVLNSVVRNL